MYYTGRMNQNKTQATSADVTEFLKGVDAAKRHDSERLITIMREITGHDPVMWGPSIIGFDRYHYKYDTGREGDMCAVGFSPRKASLTIYISAGFEPVGRLLEKLGKHKTSVACLYINKLADVDMTVLREIIRTSYEHVEASHPTTTSVDDYVAALPSACLPKFNELRDLARKLLPEADEVVSYGLLGYKIGAGRAKVYISGWKDHVAVYPVPSEPSLALDIAPYVEGKGTLWFALDEPLPKGLIERVMRSLKDQ